MSEPRGDGEGGPSERNSGAGGPASGAPGSARRRRNSRPSSRHSVYTEEPEDEIDERHQSDDSFDEDDEELGSRRTTRRRRVSFSTQPYRTHHRESSFEHQYDPLSFGDRSRSNNSNGGASAYAYVQTVPNHQYAAAGPNSHARHSSYPNPRYYPPQTLRPGRYSAPTPVHPNPFNPAAHPRPLTDRFGPGPRTQASAPNYVGHNSVWVEQNQYYPATYPQGYPTEYLVVRHARASSATRPPEADDRARHDHKSAPRRSASLSRHNHTHSKRETRDESNRSRKDRHASAARRQPEPPRDERRTKRSNREGRQRSRERMERLVEDRVESAMRRQAAASREVEQQPDFARRQMEWERSFFLGRLMNNQAEDTQSMVSRASRRVADIENVLDALDIVERRRTQVAPDPIPRSASVAPEHIYDAVFHAVRQGIAEQPQHVRPLHVERPSTVVPPAHAYDYPDPSPASSFAPPTAGAGWHNNPEDFPRRFEDRQPDVSTRYEPRDIPYSIITNPGAADQTYQPHQVPRRQVSTPGPPPGFNPMLPTPPDSDALSPGPSIGESNPFMSSRPHPPNIGRGPSSGPYRPPAGGRSSGGRGPALNVNTSNQGVGWVPSSRAQTPINGRGQLPRRPLREYSSEETDQETFLHHPRPYSAAGGSLPIAPDPPSPSTTRSRPSSRGRRLRRAVTFEEVEDEGEDGPDGHFRNFRNR